MNRNSLIPVLITGRSYSPRDKAWVNTIRRNVVKGWVTKFLDDHERIDALVGKYVPDDWGNYFYG